MNPQQEGLNRLTALLGKITQNSATFGNSIQQQEIHSQQHFDNQNPSQQELNFNFQEFNSIHAKRKELVRQARMEQEALESEWARGLDKLTKELEMIEKEIEAKEIIDSDTSELREKRYHLKRQRAESLRGLQRQMESLFQKQQAFFQFHGFPLFKVTSDLDEISKQMWVLQTYF